MTSTPSISGSGRYFAGLKASLAAVRILAALAAGLCLQDSHLSPSTFPAPHWQDPTRRGIEAKCLLDDSHDPETYCSLTFQRQGTVDPCETKCYVELPIILVMSFLMPRGLKLGLPQTFLFRLILLYARQSTYLQEVAIWTRLSSTEPAQILEKGNRLVLMACPTSHLRRPRQDEPSAPTSAENGRMRQIKRKRCSILLFCVSLGSATGQQPACSISSRLRKSVFLRTWPGSDQACQSSSDTNACPEHEDRKASNLKRIWMLLERFGCNLAMRRRTAPAFSVRAQMDPYFCRVSAPA